MASLGLTGRYYGWLMVARWPQIVGDSIARNARAIGFEDGVLTLAVPSDTWRQELQLQSEAILREIHAVPGGRVVKRLRLVRGEKG
jgi:predicted nucleic acid-binding Zn ribbon protein